MSHTVLDSITQLAAPMRGGAVIAASHAGLYSARCALQMSMGAVILHDAGIGRERAGIAALEVLDRYRVPAAAISHRSARIGDGADCLQRGVISFANEAARHLGVTAGQRAAHALSVFDAALERADVQVEARMDVQAVEARRPIERVDGLAVVALDSSSLVTPADSASIVITGSHGGLLGGKAATAIKHPVLAAAYNDADIGIDEAGVSRLAALDARGVCGFTVSAWSARVGDGLSTYEDGYVTRVNAAARNYGAEPGLSTRQLVARFIETWQSKHARGRQR